MLTIKKTFFLRTVLSTFCCLPSLTSCHNVAFIKALSTPKATERVAPFSSKEFIGSFEQSGVLTFSEGGKKTLFPFLLTSTEDSVTFVALNKFGGRAYLFTLEGKKVREERVPLAPFPFSGEELLLILATSFFSLDRLNEVFPERIIREEKGKRSIVSPRGSALLYLQCSGFPCIKEVLNGELPEKGSSFTVRWQP